MIVDHFLNDGSFITSFAKDSSGIDIRNEDIQMNG